MIWALNRSWQLSNQERIKTLTLFFITLTSKDLYLLIRGFLTFVVEFWFESEVGCWRRYFVDRLPLDGGGGDGGGGKANQDSGHTHPQALAWTRPVPSPKVHLIKTLMEATRSMVGLAYDSCSRRGQDIILNICWFLNLPDFSFVCLMAFWTLKSYGFDYQYNNNDGF